MAFTSFLARGDEARVSSTALIALKLSSVIFSKSTLSFFSSLRRFVLTFLNQLQSLTIRSHLAGRAVPPLLAMAGDEDGLGMSDSDEDDRDVGSDDDTGSDGVGEGGRAGASNEATADDDVNSTDDGEPQSSDDFSESDETDEDMFDETHTVDAVLSSMNAPHSKHNKGPAPYEILARRKREANEKNQLAFAKELKNRGLSEREVQKWQKAATEKTAAGEASRYGASALLDQHQIDKAELLAANPAFAMFLGVAKNSNLDNIHKKHGVGRGRSKKPRKTQRRVVFDEAASKLGEANTCYANGPSHWPRAIELLLEVIRLTPNDPDPYHTMSMIHDETAEELLESGNITEAQVYQKKALDYSMIGALLKPRDIDTWYSLAQKSRVAKNPRAALFCYGEALKNDSKPYARNGRGILNRWSQHELYLEIREPKKALEHLLVVVDKSKGDPTAVTRLAQVMFELGDKEGAEETLDDFVGEYPDCVDATLVNVHAETKMDHLQFEEVVKLLNGTRDAVVRSELERLKRDRVERADEVRVEAISEALDNGADQQSAEKSGALAAKEFVEHSLKELKKSPSIYPPDLTTKLAMCLLYLNRRTEAKKKLTGLRKVDPGEFYDLWYDAGVACQSVKEFEHAEMFFTGLMIEVSDLYDVPEVWERVSSCVSGRVEQSTKDATYARTASTSAVIEFYRSVAARHPTSVDATLPSAELTFARGGQGSDEDVLNTLPETKELLEQLVHCDRKGVDDDDADEEGIEGNADNSSIKKTKVLKLREKITRALALRRRIAGDDAFLSDAVPLIEQLRAAQTSITKKQKKKPVTKERWSHPNNVQKSDGVFVGYQKRDRSKKRKMDDGEDDDDDDDDEEGREEDAMDATLSGTAAPTPDEPSKPGSRLKAHTENNVPPELMLSTAHAYFLRQDYESVLKTLDDVLSLSSKVSGLSRGQTAAFQYLKAHTLHVTGNFKLATDSAKLLCEKHPGSMEAWRLHLESAMKSTSGRDVQVFVRACARVTDADKEGTDKTSVPAFLALGQAHCSRNNWRLGLEAFQQAFLIAPDEPIVSLCCGIAGAHVATGGDFSTDPEERHALVLKTIAFFQRAGELRILGGSNESSGSDSLAAQEQHYNTARGLHQIGLQHLAVPLYERCLSLSKENETRQSTDLRREAAHNLALIYKASGADALARNVLREHATV